jgi:hypothetical protein
MSAPAPKDIIEASYNGRENNSFPTDRRPQDAVAKGEVVIFSKSWCPYSTRAKELIEKKYPTAKLTVFESAAPPLL